MTRQERGLRGLEAARRHFEAEGKNFHAEGGTRSWHVQNARAILAGYFPNQTLKQWGFELTPAGTLRHQASGKEYAASI